LDDSFAALVRGPSTTYPRGFPLLFPIWLGVSFAAVWIAWLRVIGPMQWWYAGTLIGGLVIAGTTVSAVFATIRQPAFRADRNGIRLGLRTERKRPRNRQAHLWWSDVRQLRVEPRRYGLMVEISLGPAARILRRRGPARQALLWCTLLIMPFGLGRGTPRLTEPRRKDPQYRVRLYDVTPEELGLALAGLALPAVEIIVISRRYGPIMARRPQAPAPRKPAPAATPPAAAPPRTSRPAAAPPVSSPVTTPGVTAPPVTATPVTTPVTPPPVTPPPVTAPPVTAQPVTAPPVTAQPVTAPPVTAQPVTAPPVTAQPVTAPPVTAQPITAPLVTASAGAAPAVSVPVETVAAVAPAPPAEPPTVAVTVSDEPFGTDETAAVDETPAEDELADGVPGAESPGPDAALAGVPAMAAPHAGLEVAAPAERDASQPAA
jgi:hypothetical protein